MPRPGGRPIPPPQLSAPKSRDTRNCTPGPRHDIAPLTGLRFFAAMVVVLHHYPVPGVSGTLQMLQSGYFGVTLFFVLSGFVLAITYLDTFNRAPIGALDTFAAARFARIYPVYLLILLYVWLRAGASGPIVSDALLVQAWSEDATHAFALNGPGWSLSVEAFLYACFPLLIVLLQRAGVFASGRRLAVAFAIVSIAMVAIAVYFDVSGRNVAGADPHSAHRWLYRSPVSRLGDFLLRILAAGFWLQFSARMQAAVDGDRRSRRCRSLRCSCSWRCRETSIRRTAGMCCMRFQACCLSSGWRWRRIQASDARSDRR